jgi:uncharacterized membrane protein YkoI
MFRNAPLFVLTAWLGCSAPAVANNVNARGGGNHCGHDTVAERFRNLDDDYATEEYDDIRRLRQRGDILPLEQILQRVRRQRHGRVLETALQKERGRYVYNLELVDDRGHVWEMDIDATTGEVLENRQED